MGDGLCDILARTTVNLRKTVVTICSLIALASVMNYSGMITSIASGLVAVTGDFYPLVAPMITMVLCYSIADGICLGILSYVLIKMMVGKFKDLNPTLYILSIFLLFNYVFG